MAPLPGIYRHLYDARLDPHYLMMTLGQYMQSCMWPGDRPVYSGGMVHSVALLMMRRGRLVFMVLMTWMMMRMTRTIDHSSMFLVMLLVFALFFLVSCFYFYVGTN